MASSPSSLLGHIWRQHVPPRSLIRLLRPIHALRRPFECREAHPRISTLSCHRLRGHRGIHSESKWWFKTGVHL